MNGSYLLYVYEGLSTKRLMKSTLISNFQLARALVLVLAGNSGTALDGAGVTVARHHSQILFSRDGCFDSISRETAQRIPASQRADSQRATTSPISTG